MSDVFQHAKPDGDPDWDDGAPNFARMWEEVFDLARFHRGSGFRIKERRPGQDWGPSITLGEAGERLARKIINTPDGIVFELKSEADPNWSRILRRKEVASTGEKIVEWVEERIGVPYRLGFAGPNFYDCSGLTLRVHAVQAGLELPHRALLQHNLFRGGVPGFTLIDRAQVKRGDMIFTNRDEHVILYYGEYRGVECCIDTEPSDTLAPWGGMLGTGIRIRPMTGNYYNAWSRVGGIGRIISVNGAP
jgi:cell wall-associated NlpC family hydrolase